jgi:hypothetical protein
VDNRGIFVNYTMQGIANEIYEKELFPTKQDLINSL